jgi:MFS family permease
MPVRDPATTTSEQTPNTFAAWWALIVLTLALLLSYTDRQVINLLIDPIRHDLSISDTQISLLQGAAFGVFYALGGIPFGRAADTWSRRTVIVLGIIGWSVATLCCGLALTFGQMFAARVLVGVGEASLVPAAMAIIAGYFPPERRGTAIGVFLVGAASGTGISTFVSGHIISVIGAHATILGHVVPAWRMTFFVISLGGLPMALLALTLRDPARIGAGPAAITSILDSLRTFHACGRGLAYIYASIGALTIANFALLSWTPALLMRVFAETPSQVGNTYGPVVLSASVAGTLLIGIMADYVVRRFGMRSRFYFGTALCLLGVLSVMLAAAANPATVLWVVALAAFGSTAGTTLCSTGMQDIIPDSIRGLATALVSLVAMIIGLTFGPTLVAIATEHIFHSPRAVGSGIAVVAAPASLAAALLLWLAGRNLVRDVDSAGAGAAQAPAVPGPAA